MPTLEWMGKSKVVAYHRQVPYRVLERVPEKSVLDSRGSDRGNMIIHGDNLEALKALLPEYEGKVDCIYIDPPYNTGNEGWVYNDNVNDLESGNGSAKWSARKARTSRAMTNGFA